MYSKKSGIERKAKGVQNKISKKSSKQNEEHDILKFQKNAGNLAATQILSTVLERDTEEDVDKSQKAENIPKPEHIKDIDLIKEKKLKSYNPTIKQKREGEEPEKMMEISMTNGEIEGGINKDNEVTLVSSLKNTKDQTVNEGYMKRVDGERSKKVGIEEETFLSKDKKDSSIALVSKDLNKPGQLEKDIKKAIKNNIGTTYEKLLCFFSSEKEQKIIEELNKRVELICDSQRVIEADTYLKSLDIESLSEGKEILNLLKDSFTKKIDGYQKTVEKKEQIKKVMVQKVCNTLNKFEAKDLLIEELLIIMKKIDEDEEEKEKEKELQPQEIDSE
ncbi:hypothetical protein RBH29_02890 [Herbivorax sp. ANBcel31]|uniref:hypothetical protein n=1 Tax=Herbivorax sp. ANBcel31 TaxID=3069754 RepID=UPI0027AFD805|nr:hypothetical protein [Herbivorax sp. ANBcel31]MDQ2085385.1 hypothetical protein [Herbivorax sp. ANBcel31]